MQVGVRQFDSACLYEAGRFNLGGAMGMEAVQAVALT
jgi:hypothetical protein